jgi:hypothetical protein
MERFALLVGVCLLLVNSARAVPTVAVGQVSDTRPLAVMAGDTWLTLSTAFPSVRGSGISLGAFCAEAGVSALTERAMVYETVLRSGLGWDERLLSRDDGSRGWPAHTDLWHVDFGWAASESYECTVADQLLAAALNAGRLSIGKLRGLDLPLTGGQMGTLLADQEDLLGLAAPPGVVVVGSLGLGLLGWLRKRAAW